MNWINKIVGDAFIAEKQLSKKGQMIIDLRRLGHYELYLLFVIGFLRDEEGVL